MRAGTASQVCSHTDKAGNAAADSVLRILKSHEHWGLGKMSDTNQNKDSCFSSHCEANRSSWAGLVWAGRDLESRNITQVGWGGVGSTQFFTATVN
jgi:hypothetical protein